jgi:hypothetical protein
VNPPGRKATLAELAAWVCAALSARSIRAVLVGGAAVSTHTANRYQSLDVDLSTVADVESIAEVMRSLGFKRTGRVWTHPNFTPTLDFVAGPPSVGNTVLQEFMTVKTRYGPVTVVTPTQAAMDRLAAFYHWNDRQSLEQALLLARHRKVDLRAIASWSASEGMKSKYGIFRRALSRTRPETRPTRPPGYVSSRTRKS